jgi:tetraacyldisaccharide 4'-kinase
MSFSGLVRILLWPASVLYGLITRIRVWLYSIGLFKQKCLKGKVISVGNLTLGGTGKTPMVIWLAEYFLSEGKSVAILSRGYRGTGETSDEVELMKHRLQERVRFGVGPDRYLTGNKLEAEQPIDVFILDDGFQHLPLARDVNILLVDSSRPLHLETLLPAGRLREPLSALNRADLVVFTRVNDQMPVIRAIQKFPEFSIFPAAIRLIRYRKMEADRRASPPALELPPQPVFLFCGIGNPEAFVSDADRWGNVIAGKAIFRDHHAYSPTDLRSLEAQAQQAGARSFLATEKDSFNLGSLRFTSLPLYYPEIELKLSDAPQFLAALKRKLETTQEASA